MSWVEEQSWFGLEDIALEAIEYDALVREKFLSTGMWSTQYDGDIHLSQMTTIHIINCIKKCKREQWRLWALPILENELSKRQK